MSATGRGSAREAFDNYATPAWCIARFNEAVKLPNGPDSRWLEPCAGEGAIIRTQRMCEWTAVEIRMATRGVLQAGAERVYNADFLTMPNEVLCPDERAYDVCMTNPPYKHAMAFILKALQVSNHVVMLLRLNFFGSKKRAPFLRATTPDVWVLPNRPSFTFGGTDATEYAWFHWCRRSGMPSDLAADGAPHGPMGGTIRVLATTPAEARGLHRGRCVA